MLYVEHICHPLSCKVCKNQCLNLQKIEQSRGKRTTRISKAISNSTFTLDRLKVKIDDFLFALKSLRELLRHFEESKIFSEKLILSRLLLPTLRGAASWTADTINKFLSCSFFPNPSEKFFLPFIDGIYCREIVFG